MNSLFKKVVSFVSSGALLATMMMPGGMMTSATVSDPITLSKTATAKSGTTNQWDVTLEVKGSNVTINPTADIVLVIDNSGSMAGSKLSNAITAANSFVASVLTSSHPGAKIAVVSLAHDYAKVCDFTAYSSTTDNVKAVQNKISAITADGSRGTDLQGGIYEAEQLLGAASEAKISSKSIVVLSDGEPNYSYPGTATTPGSWTDDNTAGKYNYYVTNFDYSTKIGDGSNYQLPKTNGHNYNGYMIGTTNVNNSGIGAVSEAQFAKNAKYTLYTVGYGVDSGSTAEKVLQAVASSAGNYYAASVSSIQTVFNTILTAINVPVGKDGVVSDPIGSEYTFVGPTPLAPTQGNASYSAGAITWNLGSIDQNTDATLTYTVQINAGATPGTLYDTNGTTTLTYTDPNGSSQNQNFPIPQAGVNGYEVDYYYGGVQDKSATVKGTAQLGTAIPHSAKDKVGFTLEASNPVFSGDGTVTSDTTKNVITYNYAKNGETYSVRYHSPSGTVTTNPNGAAGTFGDAITPAATPTGEHITEVKVNNSDISAVGGTYTMTLGEGSNVMDVYYALNAETYTINYFSPT
ncbi:MAG: VWA domain-containing protein, partial [Clostridia bacterium]|nr:VWA domain-containing protein [Clostridia bacterium]